MTIEECYNKLNGSYSEAKSRLMSDRLVEKFMLKFPTDPTMQQLSEAVMENRNEEAFRAVHTLKGVAANLAFTELRDAASDLTEQMRGKDEPADPSLFAKVRAAYDRTIGALNEYQREKA